MGEVTRKPQAEALEELSARLERDACSTQELATAAAALASLRTALGDDK